MPQCQFPVFCCFWFQKSTSANILGIARNKRPRPYFFSAVTESEGETKRSHGAASPCLGSGLGLATPRGAVGPSGVRRPRPSAYKLPPDAKTLIPRVIFQKGFRSTAGIDDKFRGTEVSVPARRWDGELPPESSPSTPPPSSSPLLTPMMRRG